MMKHMLNKGYILAEISAAIVAISILAVMTLSSHSAEGLEAQLEQAYKFSNRVADAIIDYYEDNQEYPLDGYASYAEDPSEFVTSVDYYEPTVSSYGYILATMDDEGAHKSLQDSFVLLLLEESGSNVANSPQHLVTRCYTNVDFSYGSETTIDIGELSHHVRHGCRVVADIDSVINTGD